MDKLNGFWNKNEQELLDNYNFDYDREHKETFVGVKVIGTIVSFHVMTILSYIVLWYTNFASILWFTFLTFLSISVIFSIFSPILFKLDYKLWKKLREFDNEKIDFHKDSNNLVLLNYVKNIDENKVNNFLTDSSKEVLNHKNIHKLCDVVTYKDSKGNIKYIPYNNLLMSVVMKDLSSSDVSGINKGYFESLNRFLFAVSNGATENLSSELNELLGWENSKVKDYLFNDSNTSIEMFLNRCNKYLECSEEELLYKSLLYNGNYISTKESHTNISKGKGLYLLMKSATELTRKINLDVVSKVQINLDSIEEIISNNMDKLENLSKLDEINYSKLVEDGIKTDYNKLVKVMSNLTFLVDISWNDLDISMQKQFENIVMQFNTYKELYELVRSHTIKKDIDDSSNNELIDDLDN